MLPRATRIYEVLGREILRREKVLEIDDTISKLRFEIILGRRTGMPVKVLYDAQSDTDLTAPETTVNVRGDIAPNGKQFTKDGFLAAITKKY